MYRVEIPLFGPLSIHSFGVMSAVGFILFMLCMFKSKRRKKIMSGEVLSDTLIVGVFAALIGGRVLALLGDPTLRLMGLWEQVAYWEGGLSSLGTVIGVLLVWTGYLYYRGIPIIPFFDAVALYLPIVHIAIRIGCFLAGCCFGKPTTLAWGIVYHDEASLAPLGVALHPTQLYSIAGLIGIALFLYWMSKYTTYPGQLTGWYLILTSAERFLVDFFRGDQECVAYPLLQGLSLHQWLALMLMLLGLLLLLSAYARSRSVVSHEPL